MIYMGDRYLSRYCGLVTRDLDEARVHVGRFWERHRSTMRRGRRYGLRWHQCDLTNVSLAYVETPSAIRVECGPVADVFRISFVQRGGLRFRIDGAKVECAEDQAAVYGPGQELIVDTEPFSLLLLTLRGRSVREAMARRYDTASMSSEHWPRSLPTAAPAVSTLRSLCRWLATELDQPDSTVGPSRPGSLAVERTIRTLFLDCFDASNPAASAAEEVPELRVRLMEEWIEANLGEPITVDDLAQIGGVSVRSVQEAFRRRRQCSPMQHVINRRLEAAHRLLLMAPSGTSVTSVALDCGFHNFGRFAVRYRSVFGETPSQTRARRRSII